MNIERIIEYFILQSNMWISKRNLNSLFHSTNKNVNTVTELLQTRITPKTSHILIIEGPMPDTKLI